MDIETVKKLIQDYEPGHMDFVQKALIGERYYRNKTDILFKDNKDDDKDPEGNPLRNADNRIPRNFHGLLVNQKAAYAFTEPPTFDTGSQSTNDRVVKILGDDYRKNCMTLCVDSANTGVAWIHYWRDKDGKFDWAVCPPTDVIPVFDGSLKQKMIGALREYHRIDDATGDRYIVYEIWNDVACESYERKEADTVDFLLPCYSFVDPLTGEPTNTFEHGLGTVPFIPFWNNNTHSDDLENIKGLIDVYDKVFSGFINDLDDVQQLIFVISGYGGQNLKEFLQDLKKYKAINIDNDEDHPGDVKTLSIEIPIEARNSVLDATRKAIFEQGFGFDPRPENFGNQSGVALKFMYAPLEMKTGLMEVEFQSAFNKFVRAICDFYNLNCGRINQTWTRTAIQNDLEQAQICQASVGIVSNKTILRNHPFVSDADAEEKQIKAEKEESQQDYGFLGDSAKNTAATEGNDPADEGGEQK